MHEYEIVDYTKDIVATKPIYRLNDMTIGGSDGKPWYTLHYDARGYLIGIKYHKKGMRQKLKGQLKPTNNWLKMHGETMRRTL